MVLSRLYIFRSFGAQLSYLVCVFDGVWVSTVCEEYLYLMRDPYETDRKTFPSLRLSYEKSCNNNGDEHEGDCPYTLYVFFIGNFLFAKVESRSSFNSISALNFFYA